MVSVCFVCLGNICRSPTAEGVFRHLVREAGLENEVHVNSAGTGSWHVGDSPDRRACAAGKRRGIDITGAARQFKRSDFAKFDYVIAMDSANLDDLAELAPDAEAEKKLFLLRAFNPEPLRRTLRFPIRTTGETAGFDEVVELCVAACRPLLERIRKEHGI